jgi:3',5'-cyclic AMP phosphodiesterase CpdA
MKVAWATDVHFDAADRPRVRRFCREIKGAGAEALLLGGDIALAPDLEEWLRFIENRLSLPVYFVLGNHDFYGGDIAYVRAQMAALESRWLHWLPKAGVVSLSKRTALVGHGGWGDARHGDFTQPAMLNDYFLIRDLRESSGTDDPVAILENLPALQRKLWQLGDEAAEQLRPNLSAAMETHSRVLVLTHVPPFREACWYDGEISDDNWLPGFTCKAVGDLILELAQSNSLCDITVLCGHTHGEGEAELLPNVRAHTQGAQYGDPRFRILEID